MKTKVSLIFGIIASIALIVISAMQAEIVMESKSDYRNSGLYVEGAISSYAKKTRTAGYMTIPFVLSILAVSLLILKKAKAVKWISIFNYAIILFSILLLAFTLTGVRTTTGGITFDEIGALYIVFGVISILFSSIGLAKIPK